MVLSRTSVAIGYALITFTFFAGVINIQPRGWYAWYDLSVSGKVAQATVTALAPENHQSCSVSYTVGSRVYISSESGCTGPVGKTVAITYLPSDPEFASLQSPREQFTFLVAAPFFMSVFAGSLGSWRWARMQRRRGA